MLKYFDFFIIYAIKNFETFQIMYSI